MSRNINRGFTLVELLVVIAIIGILVALLLPAVQMAREAARRTQCTNNLKQLGIGAKNYNAHHMMFPISIGYDSPTAAKNGKGWILGTLPFLEQQNLFDQFEAAGGFDGSYSTQGLWRPECAELMKIQLPVLQCPTDPSVKKLSTQQYQWVGREVALTSYKGVIGDTRMGGAHTGSADCHTSTKCPGMFWRHSFANPTVDAKIRDGASNTFMIGEDVPAANHHSVAYFANGDYASCHAPLNYFPDPPIPDSWPQVMSFRSLHVGGAHFCMADGSVHFIPETIDLTTYQALATKAGKESASLP